MSNNIKKYEDFNPMNPGEGLRGVHTTVNRSELGANLILDPEAQIYGKEKGLKPYKKIKYGLEPIDPKKSIPIYGVYYMSQEDADNINQIGMEIEQKTILFNQLLEDATKNKPSKDHYNI